MIEMLYKISEYIAGLKIRKMKSRDEHQSKSKSKYQEELDQSWRYLSSTITDGKLYL